MKRWLWALLAALLAVTALLGVLWSREARWSRADYCLETPGQVWGVAPVPAGATATCPASQTVRAEVQRGATRVEQYELSGWQPAPVLDALTAGGYAVLSRIPDDGIQEAAVLNGQGEQLTYVADRLDGNTLVTITARGEH